jgi:hypothetical protein
MYANIKGAYCIYCILCQNYSVLFMCLQDFLGLQNGVWPMFETDKRTTGVEGKNKNNLKIRINSLLLILVTIQI